MLHLGASPGSTLRPLARSSMSREALGTQLDALQRDFNLCEAANAQMESELAIAQTELQGSLEENASLRRELQQVKALYEQLLRGTTKAEAEANPVASQCADLEGQVCQLKGELDTAAQFS